MNSLKQLANRMFWGFAALLIPQILQSAPLPPTQRPRNARPISYSISAIPDAANLRFSGSTVIRFTVLEATDTVTLNAAELEFQSATLTDSQNKISDAKISVDDASQTATFRFPASQPPGEYQLTTRYTGKINTQATGMFALDYDSPTGKKRALYTQFEAPDARRFFPCWDEPIFRTPYDLKVTVPAGQTAISNMPESRHDTAPDGGTLVRFATTPAMSSYLLFLAIGDFDRISTRVGKTEIGIVTKKGDAEKGRFALDGSALLLPYYNDYFGTPYPLPKLDNIAGPGSSQFFGAMENWGAIFTFESVFLNDPAVTTEARLQDIFETAAHEMAHQWFGNLVTMAWWNDIWLNEGFASWMEVKATAALHPEWEPLLGNIDGRERAISLDSVATTHPVVQEVATVEQMSQAFDAIAYQKGKAVITMLENYVGEEAWRNGVRDYIATYRLKNTVTDNLWEAIERAADQPVTAIAHDFTLQPGVPLICVESAECVDGKTIVNLRQTEFSRDHPEKAPLIWRVPVVAATLGGKEVKTLIAGGSGQIILPGIEPLLINSGQNGYYRTLYTPALLERLKAVYPYLEPMDQIGLLADNWGLGLAGYQSAAAALDFIDAIPDQARTRLWARAAGIISELHQLYVGNVVNQQRVARYGTARLGPVFHRLGWNPIRGEKANDAVLRAQLLSTLGKFGDPEVVAEANRLYTTGDPAAVVGPLRTTILEVVATHIDPAGWETLHTLALTEKSPIVRIELYTLLGKSLDRDLAQRALDLALGDEPGATVSSRIISAVAGNHPDLAFDFAVRNREKIDLLTEASSRSQFIPSLANNSADPAMIGKLEDFARLHMTPQSRKPADESISSIQDRIRVQKNRLPDISHWLETKNAASQRPG